MKTVRIAGLGIIAVFLLFGVFLIYSTITWYNPSPELILAENNRPDTVRCDSVYSLLSWNIGYAGLGDDMDFFYDGGARVRGSYDRTRINLDSVRHFLKRNSDQTFIGLQEVDIRSKRSYKLNEKDTICHLLAYPSVFAINYLVGFVPVPPSSPMGLVNSGILSLSQFQPSKSVRYAYPGMFSWPNRLFNLRRCMLVNHFPAGNGKEFILINTHLSAFDDGSLKKQEMQFLKDYVLAEYAKGNFVIVGGDWNQSPPGFPLTAFGPNYQSEDFILSNIPENFLPTGWKWAYDSQSPTNRYLNTSYIPGTTFCCLIDFFLVSPNIEVVENKTFNLNFRNSDHNPITMKFRLKE